MKKINGITRPLHPYQIFTYIFFSGCLLIYFLITFPLSSNAGRIVGAILEIVFGVFVLGSGYIATATDTTDHLLQEQKKLKKEGKDYSHIKSEYHCSHDRAYVTESSKHCRRCGRCTEGFDHHCKWINNDIGKKNYKSFFVMISSVFLFLATFIIFGAIVTARYVRHNDFVGYDIWIFSHSKGDILGGLVFLWIFMGIAILFALLDLNLVLFHIFLIRKGLTTFQYITLVEERKEYQKEMEIALKALGHKKKTRLDFILCLKVKKKLHRAQTATAPTNEENKEELVRKDSVRKEDHLKIGKIERDIHGHINDDELAGKKTALEFYSKEHVVTEGNELLRSAEATPKNLQLKGLTKSDDSPMLKIAGLTKEDAQESSKINHLVINIPDKPSHFKEGGNQQFQSPPSGNNNDVEELNNQEHINDVKNEDYEVNHDHHLHKVEIKSPEARTLKTPVKVRVNVSGGDSYRFGGANPLDSRHNNYMNVQDSDGKPDFFIKERLVGKNKETLDFNENISKFEPGTGTLEEGSKINTYKEIDDFIVETNQVADDHVVDDSNRVPLVEENAGVRRLSKKRAPGGKDIKIEVVS